MPFVPSFLDRLVLLKLNQGPAPFLDYMGAMAFHTALVGLELGVFDALRDGDETSEEVARRIGAQERGTRLLLEALEVLGYVRKRNGSYTNTPMTTKWVPLLAEGAEFFAYEIFERWRHLKQAIVEGKPAPDIQHDADFQPVYQAGMRALAREPAKELASRVRLPANARRLVDVGGGHGLYSIEFCRRYPGLHATIYDLPEALEVTRRVIADESIETRVSLQPGDFLRDDLGSGYDVALLCNIVHMYLPKENERLLRRVADVLNPGGLLVVVDQIAGDVGSPTARAVARLAALNLLVGTGGQTYSFAEMTGWLGAVGLTAPKTIRLRRTPGFGAAAGTKRSSDLPTGSTS